jgi:arginine utilization protein RocB
MTDTTSEWFETVREYTTRLVRIRSISPGEGENDVAREVVRILTEDGLEGGLEDAYTAVGLDAIEGDPHARHNAYAFLRGASARTVVLLGHIDTVTTADYGPLEQYALDPDALAARVDELAALTPGLAADLAAHPGDWLFGRGTIDMKCGVAANLAVMRRLAERARTEPPPLSIVVLATPDEENESAGVLQAVRFLLRLRERHGLEYVGAINTDYTTSRAPGDPDWHVYTGTIGKLLPSFLVLGKESHVGDPFDGIDANLLAADLIADLSMNPDLCDTVRGQITPPPVTLRATDLKLGYDVQLPFAAYFYLNVLTFTTDPAALLERLRQRATAALARTLGRIDEAERRWLAAGGVIDREIDGTARSARVLSYAELLAVATEAAGEDHVTAQLAAEWAAWPAETDSRTRSLHLTRRLWTLSGLRGPAVVLYYSPPFYPHVAETPCDLHDAVRAVAASHPDLRLRLEEFFPFLSDMSYLRLDPGTDVTALAANMPVWQAEGSAPRPGAYSLPLGSIAQLNLPVVNLGPYGKGAHQRGERVLMSRSFGALPALVYETIERLGEKAEH